MTSVIRVTLFALLLGTAVEPESAVNSPRVLSPHNADTHSLKTFAEFHRWRDLEGDAKVFEIFKYLTDPRTGLYPMGVPAWEGNESLAEYGAVTDPIKMLNVYPIGHCGTFGPVAAAIMEGVGIGPSRTLILPDWNHVAAETFYNDNWHYLDLDVRAIFRRADGSLASMMEARTETSLWKGPNSPHFFPLDPLSSVQRIYQTTRVDHRYGVASGGHTMDFMLRQGETFTRWWRPQDGRWNHHPSYAAKPFPRETLERPPLGPKCKHPSFTIHSHGNGRFIYKPNLTAQATDFEDGVYDSHNVQPGPGGLTLKAPGAGFAIFEVRSPYVIAPRVGDLDRTEDDREGSVVMLDATGLSVSLSLDNGLSWQGIPAAAGRAALDLSPHLRDRYGYLLRLELRGNAEEVVIRSLEITTWVQLHPASLPSLRQGRNRMRLVTGDHYGLATRIKSIRPATANRDELLKHLAFTPKDYDPERRTGRVRGELLVKASAPPGTKVAWFSAGASFAASLGPGNNTRNTISYALGRIDPAGGEPPFIPSSTASPPQDFREIYRADVPPDQSHWHYSVDREVRLSEPASELFVRYFGEPAVNQLRIELHCLDNTPREPSPVFITHAWTENGAAMSRQVRIENLGDYEIEAGANPVDEFIEMTVRSGAR